MVRIILLLQIRSFQRYCSEIETIKCVLEYILAVDTRVECNSCSRCSCFTFFLTKPFLFISITYHVLDRQNSWKIFPLSGLFFFFISSFLPFFFFFLQTLCKSNLCFMHKHDLQRVLTQIVCCGGKKDYMTLFVIVIFFFPPLCVYEIVFIYIRNRLILQI